MINRIEQRRRYGNSDSQYHLATYDQDSVVTVDSDGRIRLWEVNQAQLAKSLASWRSAVGGIVHKIVNSLYIFVFAVFLLSFSFLIDDEGRLTVERKQSGDLSSPKVGKIDPKNKPHVGGNTWAGGTGGRDTAGLGGRGGPYRLDAGHDVHQVIT